MLLWPVTRTRRAAKVAGTSIPVAGACALTVLCGSTRMVSVCGIGTAVSRSRTTLYWGEPVAKRLAKYDVLALPLKRICYDADLNCRGQFVLGSVSELADSIRQKGGGVELQGLDFPVVVQPAADVEGGLPEGFDFRLLAGHRRYRAVEFYLKWKNIPSMIRKGLSAFDAHLINLTENLERKDLNMWQEAVAMQRLYPDGVTLKRAHDELHRPTKWIAARLRLLKLAPEVQQQAAAGLLSAAFIEQLGKDCPVENQIFLANKTAK